FVEEREAQEAGQEQRTLYMPAVEPEQLSEMVSALSRAAELEAAKTMVEISQQPLRFAKVDQGGGGFIRYDIVVPPELGNIVALDASHGVRLLAQMDRTIQHLPFEAPIKRYDNVRVSYLKAASGRVRWTPSVGPRTPVC